MPSLMTVFEPRAFASRIESDDELGEIPIGSGDRIGLLHNTKANGDLVLDRIELLLSRDTSNTAVRVTKPTASMAAPGDVLAAFEGSSVVFTAMADCGSCTSWSCHDAVSLEHLGIPSVLVVSTAFKPLAKSIVATLGMPNLRMLVLEHPVGGLQPAAVASRVEAAYPAFRTRLRFTEGMTR